MRRVIRRAFECPLRGAARVARCCLKVTFFFGEEVDPSVLLYTRQVMKQVGGGNVTGAEMWRDRDWDL